MTSNFRINSKESTIRPSRQSVPFLFAFTFALNLSALSYPANAHAASAAKDKTTVVTTPSKKKVVNKVTYQRSTSEETRSERDRRMYRECKGMHNAGACKGYTR